VGAVKLESSPLQTALVEEECEVVKVPPDKATNAKSGF
jgi:hypothetical protein